MIKESIQFIADKLTELNIFEKVYSQVELVIDADGKVVPAVYSGSGKYRIVEYSPNNGTAYVRKNGKISISDIEIN